MTVELARARAPVKALGYGRGRPPDRWFARSGSHAPDPESITPAPELPSTSSGPAPDRRRRAPPEASASSMTMPNVSVKTGKDEDIGAAIDLRKRLAVSFPRKRADGIFDRFEPRAVRPITDDDLLAGQVEGEKGLQILLDRKPRDREIDRRCTRRPLSRPRAKLGAINPLLPEHQVVETLRRQFVEHGLRADHDAVGGSVKPAAASDRAGARRAESARRHIREACVQGRWRNPDPARDSSAAPSGRSVPRWRIWMYCGRRLRDEARDARRTRQGEADFRDRSASYAAEGAGFQHARLEAEIGGAGDHCARN